MPKKKAEVCSKTWKKAKVWGKVPTLSSNRSMIGFTEFCWDQKLSRKLFIEISFDATVVKVFLHGTKLLSKIKVSHLPFPSMLLDPPCNNKGRKVEQLVMFCYNYHLASGQFYMSPGLSCCASHVITP